MSLPERISLVEDVQGSRTCGVFTDHQGQEDLQRHHRHGQQHQLLLGNSGLHQLQACHRVGSRETNLEHTHGGCWCVVVGGWRSSTTVIYLGSEEQNTEGEDRGHLHDGEEQLVRFPHVLRLFNLLLLSSARLSFSFKKAHECRGNQKDNSPKKQKVWREQQEA